MIPRRGASWHNLITLVKSGLEEGTSKDWGAFVSEHRGYVIHEGTEVEVALRLQQYVPFARFKTHPVETVGQVEQVIAALLK